MPISRPGDPIPNPKYRWVPVVVIAVFLVMLAIPIFVTRYHNTLVEDNQNKVITALYQYRDLQNAYFKAHGHFAANFQELGDPEWAKMQDAATGSPTQFRGYYFKTFSAQAETAEGGAKKFADAQGKMTGFALMAIPVHYGFTGRLTFFISSANDQKLYYHDLGVKTDTNVRLIGDYFVPPGARVFGEN